MDVSLVMFKADGQKREFKLHKDITIIGRKTNCELQIPLSSVSRQHCQIEKRDDGIFLRDLGSSNGTYYNNRRIQETELSPGDRIKVGPVYFTVRIDGQPMEDEIQPVRTVLSDSVMGAPAINDPAPATEAGNLADAWADDDGSGFADAAAAFEEPGDEPASVGFESESASDFESEEQPIALGSDDDQAIDFGFDDDQAEEPEDLQADEDQIDFDFEEDAAAVAVEPASESDADDDFEFEYEPAEDADQADDFSGVEGFGLEAEEMAAAAGAEASDDDDDFEFEYESSDDADDFGADAGVAAVAEVEVDGESDDIGFESEPVAEDASVVEAESTSADDDFDFEPAEAEADEEAGVMTAFDMDESDEDVPVVGLDDTAVNMFEAEADASPSVDDTIDDDVDLADGSQESALSDLETGELVAGDSPDAAGAEVVYEYVYEETSDDAGAEEDDDDPLFSDDQEIAGDADVDPGEETADIGQLALEDDGQDEDDDDFEAFSFDLETEDDDVEPDADAFEFAPDADSDASDDFGVLPVSEEVTDQAEAESATAKDAKSEVPAAVSGDSEDDGQVVVEYEYEYEYDYDDEQEPSS